jgi:hypothetical protein
MMDTSQGHEMKKQPVMSKHRTFLAKKKSRLGDRPTNDKAASRRLVVQSSHCHEENLGAGEGARTLDPDLGKVVLYH